MDNDKIEQTRNVLIARHNEIMDEINNLDRKLRYLKREQEALETTIDMYWEMNEQ